MAINAKKQINFHFESLPRATKNALDFLAGQAWLKNTKWYLAGGTALALSTGVRKSVDLDFFTSVAKFRTESVVLNLKNSAWKTTLEEPNTLYGTLLRAKISFIANSSFVPRQEMLRYRNIKILQPRDIAVMKIIAISQRGRKRDFFDLYWCANNLEPLENLIKRLKTQYPSAIPDYNHILKSLVFFEDAENDPEPELNMKVSWKSVKSFFIKEVPRATKNLIQLN